MAAPKPSSLDHQQCIQGSFDESTGRLRVDALITSATIEAPGLEVSILSLYDNIAIRNSNNSNELLINSDGSINVKLNTSSIEIGKVDQGAAGTQAWLVDGSGVIQPVSNTNLISIDSKLTTTNSDLSSILSALGSPFQAGGSIGNTSFIVTQTTGTNLHTVVDSGTISWPSVSSATCTNVASSASNVTLLSSNSSRKMATFYNDSTSTVYLKLGSTASSSSFTILMVPTSYYELPKPIYTGQIDAIWASANGNMRITEY